MSLKEPLNDSYIAYYTTAQKAEELEERGHNADELQNKADVLRDKYYQLCGRCDDLDFQIEKCEKARMNLGYHFAKDIF